MKLRSDNLAEQLRQRLLPVYLVSGDEPLQAGEAADAVRAAARAAGCTEREVHFIERGAGSSWEEILQSAQALSLFASRRIVEIRIPSGKLGNDGAQLERLIALAGEDLLVLILSGRIEGGAKTPAWASAAEERGAWLAVRPVEAARLPAWIHGRLQAAGVQASEEAVALLTARTEGNLLAARQEIERLALLHGGAVIGVGDVAGSVGDSTRFTVFNLGDAIGAADAARALRVLAGLRAEGEEAVLVIWALLRELHALESEAAGRSDPAALRQRGWAPPRARRAPLAFAALTRRAGRADRMAKGAVRGEVWDELALLATELCGVRTLPL
ncbi:MAG: DNA polymerase III subunit delta [Gammaproteobacteria bacterium]|nr:DNA polymerase III subunit delta [Gammaproteobacteria bacterium]